MQSNENQPREIEVFEVGSRRLDAKTSDQGFAIFEDELTPEELIAIARDITARRARFTQNEPLKNAAAWAYRGRIRYRC